MRTLLLTLATCLIAISTQAQTDEANSHLKKKNHDELFVEFYEDRHCGWDLESVVNDQMKMRGLTAQDPGISMNWCYM